MTNPTSPIPLLPGLALHGAVLALLQGEQPATMQIGSAWMNLLLTVDAHLQEQSGANIAQAQLDLGIVTSQIPMGAVAKEEEPFVATGLALPRELFEGNPYDTLFQRLDAFDLFRSPNTDTPAGEAATGQGAGEGGADLADVLADEALPEEALVSDNLRQAIGKLAGVNKDPADADVK